jgi:DNA processing protein
LPDDFGAAPRPLPDESELEKVRFAVIELLDPTPVEVDELIRQCQVSAAVVLTVLLELELAGRLDRHPGGNFQFILKSVKERSLDFSIVLRERVL